MPLKKTSLVEVAMYIVGLIGWMSVIFRAYYWEITPDEASTFFDFIQPFDVFPFAAKWEANNHFLNSLLSGVFVKIFGDGLLTLRAANILAYPLGIWCLIRLLKVFGNGLLQVAILIILALSPLCLELFSLSRGYGLSISFLFAALYFSSQRRLWTATLFGVLMVWSNLSTIPVFLFLPVLFDQRPSKLSKKDIGWTVIWMINLAASVIVGFMLKNEGLLYYGTDQWLKFFAGYTTSLFVGIDWLWWWFIIPLIATIMGLFRLMSNRSDFRFRLLLLFGLLIFFIGAQHLILGTPLPMDRTAVHVIVLLVLVAGLSINDWKYSGIVMLLVSAPVVVGAFHMKNIACSQLWGDETLPAHYFESLNENNSIGTDYPTPSLLKYQALQKQLTLVPSYDANSMSACEFVLAQKSPGELHELAVVESFSCTKWNLWKLKSPNGAKADFSQAHSGEGNDEYLNLLSLNRESFESENLRMTIELSGENLESLGQANLVFDYGGDEANYYHSERLSSLIKADSTKSQASFAFTVNTGPYSNLKIYVWNKDKEPHGSWSSRVAGHWF